MRLNVLPNDIGTTLRLAQLNQFADAGKLATNLNTILQEILSGRGSFSSDVLSTMLNEITPAINALWDISLQADIQPRLMIGEYNELRQILARQNGWDPQNAASFQVINSEDIQHREDCV